MVHETSKGPNSVKFVYQKPDDYEMFYSNGVFGGITPRGDVQFNFFNEHADSPNVEHMKIKDGMIIPDDKESNVEDELAMTRDLKVGIIMMPNQAESFANWLLDKVNEVKSESRND